MTIEEKTAATLLQRPMAVKVGAESYQVSPPSVATLILVSEVIATLPKIRMDGENVAGECLAAAKDFKGLGDIAAILILGAKKIEESSEPRTLWGKCKAFFIRKGTQRPQERLSRSILMNYAPAELNALVAKLLQGLELGDFFALTTFLTEVNLLRATKVEN